MFSKLIHSKAVGFSIKEDTIDYALVSFFQNKIQIYEADSIKIESKAALHKLQSYLRIYPSAVYHHTTSVLIKNINDQQIPKKDKQKILNYQIESLAAHDPLIFNEPLDQDALIAIKEKSLNELKDKLKALDLKPQKIILKPVALLGLCHLNQSKTNFKIALFFNPTSIDFIFTDQDQLKHHSAWNPSLYSKEQIALKILRLIYVLSQSKSLAQSIEIYGLCDKYAEIIDILQTHLGFQISKIINKDFEPQYSGYLPEISLALNVLASSEEGLIKINFFDLYHLFCKRIKAHLLLVSMTILFSVLFWQMKFNQIKSSNQQLLVQNLSILGLADDKPLKFSFDQLTKLKSKIIEIKKKQPPFSYQVDIPTVSEVLLYLSEMNQNLHLKTSSSFFIIEDFKYNLLSYPSVKNPNTPYKVQVTFSFSTDSSLTARKVHESLLKAKSIIDLSKKVDWSYQNNCYKVSFYLKNLAPTKLYD